jgi:hypothetical protein
MFHTLLIILLGLLLIAALPSWPYNKTWGYYFCSVLGAILAIVLVLTLSGRL